MKQILLIDDNGELRENTAEIIELANYEVLTADNGKSGVELALKERPDLIICDIMMPVLDGYGVYHLLSKHKETAHIPFIFLTAKSEKSDFRKGMEMGADDYIAKPFDGTELLHAIEVRLKKADLMKEEYKGAEGGDHFLQSLPEAAKLNLASDERLTISYDKKSTIYKPGMRPRALYYIVSGKVKIARTNDDGKEFITNIFAPGDYFGYAPILENSTYKDEAQALEETVVMLIPPEDFLQLVSNDMNVAQSFIKIINRNIAHKEEGLLNLAYNSLRKKVAYGLIQLVEKYKGNEGKEVVLNLSRENMAQSFGIATESLIRTLADFKDEKLVALQTGKVKIRDEKKLRDLPY